MFLRKPGSVVWIAGAAGHQRGFNAQRAFGPGGKLLVEVLGGVGEGGEDDDLAVAAIDGVAAFVLNHFAQAGELGVAGGIDLLGRCQQGGQAVAVFDEVLLPADQIDVAEQHLDLAPDQQALEGRVVDVDIGDVDFFDFVGVCFDMRQGGFHILQLPLDGQREGRHRAFHALEHIDAQQVNQAFFTVHLAEEALAAANLGAVLGVVGGLLVRQHVAQRCIAGQIEAANFQVDVANGAKFAAQVHIRLDVDRRQTIRETACFAGAVVFFNVPARAGDGEMIQQGEVVKAQHFDQAGRRLFRLVQCPASD